MILFGTSMPTVDILSGIGAMRTLTTPRASAISPARFVSLLSFTPPVKLKIIACDRGTSGRVNYSCRHAEALYRILKALAVRAQLLIGVAATA